MHECSRSAHSSRPLPRPWVHPLFKERKEDYCAPSVSSTAIHQTACSHRLRVSWRNSHSIRALTRSDAYCDVGLRSARKEEGRDARKNLRQRSRAKGQDVSEGTAGCSSCGVASRCRARAVFTCCGGNHWH